MPSFSHEKLVELFRNRGELAAVLLDVQARISFPYDHVEQASIDLTQVVSTEYRADAVVELRDASNAPVAAIIVEVQLGIDRDKEYSWPLYVPALRARKRCPVVLLVVTDAPAVARWARATIALGHPGYDLTPIVIELAETPRVTDSLDAQRLPELAVLSAVAHRELAIAKAAVDAIVGIDALSGDQKRLYLHIILMALPSAGRAALEAHMHELLRTFRDEIASRDYEQGFEIGCEKGCVGLRRAAIALLQLKLGVATPDEQASIEAMHDVQQLTELVVALVSATSDVETRAALAPTLARR